MIIESQVKKWYLIYLLGKIIPGIVGLLSVSLFIRLFGEKIYGEFSILFSTLLLVVSFSTGWLVQGIIRFHSSYRENESQFIINVMRILHSSILIIILLSFPVLLYLEYNFIIILQLQLSFIFASYYAIFLGIQQVNFKPSKIVLSNSLKAIFFISIPYMLHLLKVDNSSLVIILSGVFFSYLIGIVSIYNRDFNFLSSLSFKCKDTSFQRVLSEVFNYGWPLSIWFLIATLLDISDKYFIKFYYNYELVGSYSAIYDIISKGLIFFFLPLILSVHPLLTKLYNENKKKRAYNLLYKAILLELVFFISGLIILFFLKKYLINFLGLDVNSSMPLIIPIYIGLFLWNVSILIHKILELKKKTKKMLLAVSFGLIINVIGNIIYLPIYGVVVSAYTTIAGSVTYILIILYFIVEETRRVKNA